MPPTRRRLLLAALAIGLAPGATAAQQPTRIVGRVTSEAGAPIAAATVAIQSLGLGAATDENGSFALTVPADRARGQTVAVLVRAIGYRSDTAQVTLAPGEVQQNFSLATNPLRLGEVVITGAGTTSEVQKLGSVRENVDSSLLRRANEPNVVTALAAKAPNVDVVSSAGDPGASSSIRIRGAT
jgi:TonB-dependent starch-binding outer membrane protein SusC